MARKKLSEMSLMERVDRRLEGATWDEAEQVGIEIIARCMALHIYSRKEGSEYLEGLMEKICKRADEWAHEGNHPLILAFASAGYEKNKKEKKGD